MEVMDQMTNTQLQISTIELLEAWQLTLPTTLNDSDQAEVKLDEANEDTLRIHIKTAGHTGYTFDFACKYVDAREVKVELVDVEKDGLSVDEHTSIIQTLTVDYVRHIHECAQVLHELTHK
jgi:hypothetical protein